MAKKQFYHLNIPEVFSELGSDPDGLSEREAAKRLLEFGKNQINTAKPESNLAKFLDQFKDAMVVILLIAAIVSGALAIVNHESLIDSVIILLIVLVNAILGFVQEKRADHAVEALSKIQVAMVKVKRQNETLEIPSQDLVPGDVIVLEAGDRVPADGRIISATVLRLDESTLTGESDAVEKGTSALRQDIPLAKQDNMVFAGTTVVNGRGVVVVCETGLNTQLGLIADSLTTVKREITPLQQKINNVGRFLTGTILTIIVVMVIIGIVRGEPLLDTFMMAVSLAVAAIPEGLAAVITVVMSIGASDMAKRRAVVRKMQAVETLGSTDVICSDKTGTITRNQMQVIDVYFDGELCEAEKILPERGNILVANMALANDAEKNHQKYLGDPTEVALYEGLEQYFNVDKFRDQHPRVGELPFDSERKLMSVVVKQSGKGDKFTVFTKGSLDSLLKRCDRVWMSGKAQPLTTKLKRQIAKIAEEESSKALRVLAYAYRDFDKKPVIDDELETKLIFAGLTAMRDAPRPDVKHAISVCKTAGITPVMITGDSLATAVAVAQEVGILEDKEQAIEGIELDDKSLPEMKKIVQKYTVYARVSPMNKVQIVRAWQQLGKVVAMTGDGVNDAPALKAADVGVGMGQTGTEVAKAEADVILMDDSFATIVTAIREGRRIFDNIRGVLVYLLTGNFAEVVIVFVMSLLPEQGTLTPIQLLYINLITDSIPAITLAFEKEDKDIMKNGVKSHDRTFFTPFLISKMAFSAILKIVATFAILLLYGTTPAFFTLVLLEMAYAYSCRNLKKPLWRIKGQNRNLNIGMIALGVVQLIVFFTPVRSIMGLEVMKWWEVLASVGVVLGIWLIDELSKIPLGRVRDL